MTTHVLWVIVHSLAVVVFVNRYVAGIILRIARRKNWDETRDDYEPTVTAVIPMFNEGAAIKETLQSLLDSDYPHDKLKRHLRRRLLDRRQLRARPRGRARRRTAGSRSSATASTSASAARSSARPARPTREIIVSVDSDVVVDRRRDPPAHPPVHRRPDRRGRRLGRRPQQAGQLAHPDAGGEVLVLVLLHEEPRVGVPPRDVPVGLPHRVPPRGPRRARAGAREALGARRADQVRRGSLPDPPDRQGRLPHDDDARRALPHVRADAR